MTDTSTCIICGTPLQNTDKPFCSPQCADMYLAHQMDRIESEIRQKHPSIKCPVCGKPGAGEYKPFCSKRCADIDLGRWMKGSYVIHTDESPDDDSAETEK